MKQEQHDDTATFADKVKMRYDVFKAAGGSFITKNLIEYALARHTEFKLTMAEFSVLSETKPSEASSIEKVHKAAEEIMLATIMVKNCNQKLYNNIDENLRMDFAKGMDNKPLTVTDAQETLNQIRKAKNQPPRNPNPNSNPRNPNSNPNQQKNGNKDQDRNEDKPAAAKPKADETKRSAAHQLLLKGGDDIYSGSGSGFIFAQIATRTTPDPFTTPGSTKPKFSMDMTEAEDFALVQNDAAIDPMWIHLIARLLVILFAIRTWSVIL